MPYGSVPIVGPHTRLTSGSHRLVINELYRLFGTHFHRNTIFVLFFVCEKALNSVINTKL